jgi:cytochrome d ubiquinol oxidase subunit II
MNTYSLLQHYWWLVVSLLAAILVFLLFVQGGNSLLFHLGRNERQRRLLVNSTGRKWEFTFTMLVVFGGAFFASFPLFYSTSFGGAYWLWMIILFSFVLQAVSYEFQGKEGNLLGRRVYQSFLVLNGIVAPLLIGAAVATFFTGSDFTVDRSNIGNAIQPVISQWGSPLHGLDALGNPWTVVLGLAILTLSQILGLLYFINNIDDEDIERRARRTLLPVTAAFLVFFLSFLIRTLVADGFAADSDTGEIRMESYKYLHNLIAMPAVTLVLLAGIVCVLYGIVRTLLQPTFRRGIWTAGIGTILTVLAVLLTVGYCDTAYYPSTADLQSSLTIANSSSSPFTLKTMAWVTLWVPVVIVYMVYAWRKIDSRKISGEEIDDSEGTSY